jgi:prophage regulatory protein
MNLLTYPELRSHGIPYSEEHVRRLMKSGQFPKAIKLGPHVNARKAWVADEIDAWIAAKIAERDAAAA